MRYCKLASSDAASITGTEGAIIVCSYNVLHIHGNDASHSDLHYLRYL